jgi:hypothetical protein
LIPPKDDEVAAFTSERAPMRLTHGPIIVDNGEVEKTKGDEEDEEAGEGDATSNNFALSDISSQGQLQPAPSPPSLHLASFSKHERRRIEISSYNDPDPVRTFPEQTIGILDSKEASMAAFIDAEIRASINLDQFFEAAGFTFNK